MIDDGNSSRTINQFKPKVDYYSSYTDDRPVKKDEFRVAAFLQYNKNIIVPSLFSVRYEHMYLPNVGRFIPPNQSIGYGEHVHYPEVERYMGNISMLEEGLILQFNKLSDRNGRAILFELIDLKNTEEIMLTKSYRVEKL